MKTAIFPGSFDPLTKGHFSTARKASRIFDKVYVIVMTNTKKHYLFSADERVALAQTALAELDNVEIIKAEAELTVNVARKLGASYLIRGLRNETDFNYEKAIASLNSKLDPEIETVLFFSNPGDSAISSSMVKEIAQFHGDIGLFVTPNVEEALRQKYEIK